MIQKLKRTILITAISMALLLGLAATPALAATCDTNSTADTIQCGVNTGGGTNADTTNAGTSISTILTNVINIFSLIIGIIAVIVIIIAGLSYITSGGDSGKTAQAKNTILYAVVGLIIVAFAQVIVRLAVNTGNGGNPPETAGTPSSTSSGSGSSGTGTGSTTGPVGTGSGGRLAPQ